MPSTRRRPNTVASHAIAGATKICEPMPAALRQAPSSKPSEKAPRKSASPTDVNRLSKLARKEPSRTAPTANSGRGAMPPRETGPRPPSFSAIRPHSVRMDVGNNGHPRQQALEQFLVLVELNANRD